MVTGLVASLGWLIFSCLLIMAAISIASMMNKSSTGEISTGCRNEDKSDFAAFIPAESLPKPGKTFSGFAGFRIITPPFRGKPCEFHCVANRLRRFSQRRRKRTMIAPQFCLCRELKIRHAWLAIDFDLE